MKKRKKAPPKRRATKRSHPANAVRLPKGALTLVVILRAKEGQGTLLEAELRALVSPTRKEAGCLTYDLHRSADANGSFLLHEVWATREHHTQHTRSPHFLRWNARKDSLLTSRDATFWTQIV